MKNKLTIIRRDGSEISHTPTKPGDPIAHHRDCEKVPHVGAGYRHAADDDSPYFVCMVPYCGRCHKAIFDD